MLSHRKRQRLKGSLLGFQRASFATGQPEHTPFFGWKFGMSQLREGVQGLQGPLGPLFCPIFAFAPLLDIALHYSPERG